MAEKYIQEVEGGETTSPDQTAAIEIDNGVTSEWVQIKNLFPSGTYTPTLTNVANITSSSITADFIYVRVGSVVIVAGQINVQHTGSGLGTIGISLPIASAFAASQDGNGNASHSSATTNYSASIVADATNDRMQLNVSQDVGTSSLSWRVWFMYRVI